MVCTAATDTQHRYALPEHRYFTLRAIRQAVTAAVSAACGNRDSDCPEIQKAALSAASYSFGFLERAMRFELTTPTLARLCSTPELRPRATLVAPPVSHRRNERCLVEGRAFDKAFGGRSHRRMGRLALASRSAGVHLDRTPRGARGVADGGAGRRRTTMVEGGCDAVDR